MPLVDFSVLSILIKRHMLTLCNHLVLYLLDRSVQVELKLGNLFWEKGVWVLVVKRLVCLDIAIDPRSLSGQPVMW